MKFEHFGADTVTFALRGDEIAGIYLALAERESELDRHQLRALEALRQILYERFTIEEMESFESMYASRLNKPGSYR